MLWHRWKVVSLVQIKYLSISNFRGIKQLEWKLDGNLICLIGPGDSTKTTILDAIEYVMSSRFLRIYDTDFYNCDVNHSIEITATIGQLPPKITALDSFGYQLRGWTPEGELRDEPQEGDEHVLTIKLTVDKTLEPQWSVVNDRVPDGVSISSGFRESIGVCRISDNVNFELGWARGSTLAQGIHTRSAMPILAEVGRKARSAFLEDSVDELVESAKSATEAAKDFGVIPGSSDYAPGLDAAAISSRAGAITLYDGCIPIRQFGLGTRRLVATAIQRSAIDGKAILLLDEIEHGLEPYRLRYLLRMLQAEMERGSFGQVIMTTHSPTAVVELCCDSLRVVRKTGECTIVQSVDSDLQSTVRACPESLLSRKVIVCEGKTEYGLLRGIEDTWAKEHESLRLSHLGVALQDGNGHEAPKHAKHLRSLGYDVALFADSDEETSKSDDCALQELGVSIIRWSDELSTEQRICLDVPENVLQEMVLMILDSEEWNVFFDKIAANLKCNRCSMTNDISTWLTNGVSISDLRLSLGAVAKKNKWFKRIDYGEWLGSTIGSVLTDIVGSDLAVKLGDLEQWAYGN